MRKEIKAMKRPILTITLKDNSTYEVGWFWEKIFNIYVAIEIKRLYGGYLRIKSSSTCVRYIDCKDITHVAVNDFMKRFSE